MVREREGGDFFFPFNTIFLTILLVGRFSKLFCRLASRDFETRVQ